MVYRPNEKNYFSELYQNISSFFCEKYKGLMSALKPKQHRDYRGFRCIGNEGGILTFDMGGGEKLVVDRKKPLSRDIDISDFEFVKRNPNLLEGKL